MKNILKIFITTCFIGGSVYAQQIPLTSQYMFNDYLLNPAVAGSTDSINISLSARAQWTGLEGAPKTQFFSIDSKVGEKMGVGGYVYNDETGPISERGIQLSYAYHLNVSDNAKLAFSLAGIMFFHDINTAQLRPEESGDDALNNMKINAVSPDVNFGMMFYTSKYKVGFSSSQLLENNLYGVTAAADNNLNKLARHYYLFADYKIEASDKITVVPSVLMKYLQGAPVQFDINARVIYDQKFWLGASYRYNNAIVALVGVNYKNFSFGYAYDYTTTEIRDFSTGGHEIFLSLRMPTKPTVRSAPSIN
ncbi:MAG TPA: type IX secretion system membrane protein PorP/SprF [Vicingaceae bacterium]